jgi:repressor LexA
MIGLTPRQRRCLDAIQAFQTKTGTMPSIEELRAILGLASKSAVSQIISRLVERGAVRRVAGRARAIAIATPRCPHCGVTLQVTRGGQLR